MPRFDSVIGQQPRFALAIPRFRFRALAAYAGRAALGGDREVAMACLVVGRLASTMLPPFTVASPDLRSRSVAAKQWLASLSLPAAIRTPAGHVADSVATGSTTATAWAIEKLLAVAGSKIDEASAAELRSVAADLSPPPVEPVTPSATVTG